MKKTLLWSLVPWLVAVLVIALCNVGRCEVKALVIGMGGWNQATWENGRVSSPDGSMKTDAYLHGFWQIEIQVRTDLGLPWDLQPTLAGFYQQRKYDFSTIHTPIQNAKPTFHGVMIGITKEFKLVNVYLVGGVAHYDINLHMVERIKGGYVDHGDVKGGIVPVIELGIYKMFEIDKTIGIGPFVGLQVYPTKPGFHRCRNFDMGNIAVLGGIGLELNFLD